MNLWTLPKRITVGEAQVLICIGIVIGFVATWVAGL